MALNEEEKNRIIEEEEIRCKVRRKHEQKSSGVSAVLSFICPGLGQVYNGQIIKGGFFLLMVLIGLTLLVYGTIYMVKPATAVNVSAALSTSNEQPVQTNDEGMVVEEMQKSETDLKKEDKAPTKEEKKVTKGLLLTVIGLVLMIGGDYVAVKNAIRVSTNKNAKA